MGLKKYQRLALAMLMIIAVFSDQNEVPYGTGDWDSDTTGNHRAVIRVGHTSADAVWVRIPWRRRDRNPQKKKIVIHDSAGQRIHNFVPLELNREFGVFVFEPASGPGRYFVYYLIPHMEGRSNYPKVSYPEPETTADPTWKARIGLQGKVRPDEVRARLPQVQIDEIQSIDAFNSFFPMEVIASEAEVEALKAHHPGADFLLFAEDRRYPIRMTRDLPRRWMREGAGAVFEGKAERGEYYVFQVGVFACRSHLSDIDVTFSGLTADSGAASIGSDQFTCFNTGGTDWRGIAFEKTVAVEKGRVQALWCGLQIPDNAVAGEYSGSVTVSPHGFSARDVKLHLTVTESTRPDAGDNEPWRHSRLRWLNSQLALDDGLVEPYIPLEVENKSIRCLGRVVELDGSGFPASIRSFFTPDVTSVGERARDILSGPIRFVLIDAEGNELTWIDEMFRFENQSDGAVTWSIQAEAGPFRIQGRARMEFDGFLDFKIQLVSEEDIRVEDIGLRIPFRKAAARYMMGMGVKGGFRPQDFRWSWKVEHNQDSLWLGDVNAGMQCSFRDDRYSRPLNTNFYLLKPLVMPDSWWNGGRGGCEIKETDAETAQIFAFSGPREISAGNPLNYYFSLLVTPFRPINPKAQWATRFYHRYEPLDTIAATGANTINVHHATEINPWINYPFLRPQAMRNYIDQAHQRGMKVKIYYTVRELSNRAPELFALRSLGDEIFFPGQGGGFSWLQEHLDADYIAAWFVPGLKDAAVINSGASRWHNYYVEGLNWLVRHVGIDGLYIDDVAFDRVVMKRVRKVLDRHRPGSLIDLHSANQFNARDGFANSANLYLEHFPYIDRLWFGEYFDYDAPPEYWLVEVSGIPFGLMGEMLQAGGNAWRGMLYGMTARLPWAGDPRPLWKVWDDFGLQEAEMVGYWSSACPVKTGRTDILATVYRKPGAALLALASWADEAVRINLDFDWDALDMDPGSVRLRAPFIPDFQAEALFEPGMTIPVPAGKGWLLILAADRE